MSTTGIDSTSLASLNSTDPAVPQTYIVAQNPEVLAHLMRENESRGSNFTPAAYTAPASVFNTVAVDFERKDDQPQPILKTCPIPVQTLQKLDPEVGEDVVVVGDGAKRGSLERVNSSRGGSLERKSVSPQMNSLERRKG